MSTPAPHAEQKHGPNAKEATVNGLAVVGFVALIAGGIYLAVSAAGMVPQTLSGLASAVYLFDTTSTSTVKAVPTPKPTTVATTTKPVTPVVTTPVVPTTSTPTVVTPTTPKPTTGGPLIVPTRRVIYNQPQLYGSPDLMVEVLEVGYLRSSSVSSFRESSSAPSDERPAIRFRVTNVGTNATPTVWQTEIEYPAENGDDTYTLTTPGTLMPGGYKDFTFAFDNPEVGKNREFTVTADPRDSIRESNERNNEDTAEIDIKD